MKELDLLLERFLRRQQAALDAGAWPELEGLLEQEDDVLWDWLQDPSQARAKTYRTLLVKIRETA